MYHEEGGKKICVSKCPDGKKYKLSVDGQQKCDGSCALFIGANSMCQDSCDAYAQEEEGGKRVCVSACNSKKYQIVDGVKLCKNECLGNYTAAGVEETRCIAGSCEEEEGIPLWKKDHDAIGECRVACPDSRKYVSGSECVEECESKIYITINGIATCQNICPDETPYLSGQECKNSCGQQYAALGVSPNYDVWTC